MQEIERRPNRSSKDETELAQLQVKQQQILASGRPVHAGPVTQVWLPFVNVGVCFLSILLLCSLLAHSYIYVVYVAFPAISFFLYQFDST